MYPLPLERALGIVWLIEKDAFGFRMELKDTPLTRRGILSTISSIFDPVGYVAPVLLEGKRILQNCVEKVHPGITLFQMIWQVNGGSGDLI